MTGLIPYESADHVATITINRADKRNAFSVGADLKEVPINFWQSAPVTGVAVSKPIVAAPFGWCVGGGFVMAQMSDLCVAAIRENGNRNSQESEDCPLSVSLTNRYWSNNHTNNDFSGGLSGGHLQWPKIRFPSKARSPSSPARPAGWARPWPRRSWMPAPRAWPSAMYAPN